MILDKIAEPSWLAEFRKSAQKTFEKLPPDNSQYTKLSIDYQEALQKKPAEKSELSYYAKKLISDSKKIVFCQIDDDIVYVNLPKHLKSRGVIFTSVNDAIKKHEDKLRDFFKRRSIKPNESKNTAFNCANFRSGFFLFVPADMVIEEPIRYLFISSAGATSVSQILVDAQERSSLTVMDESFSETGDESVRSSVVDILVGQDAKVGYFYTEELGENTLNLVTKRASVGKDGSIRWIVGRFGTKTTKSLRDTMLMGEGAEVDDLEIFIGSGRQHYDVTSNIWHRVPHTRGNVSVRGVLMDEARSVSQGMIRIDKNAQKTDSFLAEHTLMLDPRARSDAIPGLEIEANDVRATHSASTSQIDKEQIFYLTTRGLSEEEAKNLIALGFLEASLRKISDQEISDHFREMIRRKWDSSVKVVA